jgi:hypothetical protein
MLRQHGGRREGAGRKPTGDEALVRMTVLLRPDQAALLRRVSAGGICSASQAVRDALDETDLERLAGASDAQRARGMASAERALKVWEANNWE